MKSMKQKIVIAGALFVALWITQTAFAWYDPSLGRWLTRDPISEPGFQALQRATTHSQSLLHSFEPSRWINRGSVEDKGGQNLYQFVGNDPISRNDAFGLVTQDQIDELKREIELIQRMRDLANQMIDNYKNCKPQCLGVSSVVAHYCNCYRDYAKNCDDFAKCICIQLPDDRACRARAVKACNIAKQMLDAYDKTKGKGE